MQNVAIGGKRGFLGRRLQMEPIKASDAFRSPHSYHFSSNGRYVPVFYPFTLIIAPISSIERFICRFALTKEAGNLHSLFWPLCNLVPDSYHLHPIKGVSHLTLKVLMTVRS